MSDVENALDDLGPLGDAQVSPAVGVASVALTLALKYHDINTVQDGALYQQYKLEGKNMHALHLDHVFETAMRIEQHLLLSPNRLSETVYRTLVEAMALDPEAEAEPVADRDDDGATA